MIVLVFILTLLCGATVFLEIIPVLFLKNRWKWILPCMLCNVLTNPLLNTLMVFLTFWIEDYSILYAIMIVLEVGVVFLEAMIYHLAGGERFGKCLLISAICNGISFGIGFFLLTNLVAAWDRPPSLL